MKDFNIHFFKKSDQRPAINGNLHAYLLAVGVYSVENEKDAVKYVLRHPDLQFKAAFYITRSSSVPELWKLNPEYYDINFRLSFPFVSPTYFVELILNRVKHLCETFGLVVYSEFFKDILPFDQSQVLEIFKYIKGQYKVRHPEELISYLQVSPRTATLALTYLEEYRALSQHFSETGVFVPRYKLLKDNKNNAYFAVVWPEKTGLLVPPVLDLVYLEQGEHYRVLDFKQIKEIAEAYLEPVPGFLKESKIIPLKRAKKVQKLILKHRLPDVEKQFTECRLHNLVD